MPTQGRSRKFNARWLDALRPPEVGQVEYYDSSAGSPGGFGVRCSQGGSRSFFIFYRRNGRLKRHTLGRYPALSLKEARRLAQKIHGLREDPAGEKARARRAGTFEQLCQQFLDANKKRLRPKTFNEWERIIRVELTPEFGQMAPHAITRGDVKDYLRRKAETAPIMSNRVFETIRRVYCWAVAEDKVTASPVIGIKKPGVEHERERILNTTEIRSFWSALDQERPVVGNIFRLLLVTGARSGEVLSTKWTDLDFEQGLWTLPVTKGGKKHVVPLSAKAAKLFKSLHPLSGHADWVFIGPTGGPITTIQKGASRIRKRSDVEFRPHDLRRTFATGLAQIGVRPDVISAILGHIQSGPQATRVYERHSRIPEMRHALERWASHLEHIVSGKTSELLAFPGK